MCIRDRLKTEFFSNVSHEIKTPIAVVMNTAELLRGENLSPEGREHVETIIRASKRLSTLITDILKLNKLEKQTISPQPEPYDLCAQLAECALQFEDTWERKGVGSVSYTHLDVYKRQRRAHRRVRLLHQRILAGGLIAV